MTQKLIIPHQTPPISDPQHRDNLQVIQRWASTVGGTYASLTGAGETQSPGGLTQEGPFDVENNSADPIQFRNFSAGAEFLVDNTAGGPIKLEGPNITGGIQIIGGGGSLQIDSSSGAVTLTGSPSDIVNSKMTGSMEVACNCQFDAGLKLGFFGATPILQETVTGSRGGNVALGDLLAKLATIGLIIDSTTP